MAGRRPELLSDLDSAMLSYLERGFEPFLQHWQSMSAMYQQKVTIQLPRTQVHGVEVGVESNGALRLNTEQGVEIFHSGEVSLRKRY